MISKLIIENFFSIEKAEIDLLNRGLVLIEGINNSNDSCSSNGAGKSSIFEAILWCLYEKTLRGYSKDDVINIHRVKSGCAVSLVLEDGSILRRTRKHPEYKTSFTLDEKEVEKDWAEKNIGLSYNSFLYVLMMGQNSGFTLASAKDSDIKSLYSNALLPDSIDAIGEDCSAKLKYYDSENQKLISLQEHEKNLLEQKIQRVSQLKQEKIDWDKSLAVKRQELQVAIDANKLQLNEKLEEYSQHKDKFQREIKDPLNSIQGRYLSLNQQKVDIEGKLEKISFYTSQILEVEKTVISDDSESLISQKQSLKAKIDDITGKLGIIKDEELKAKNEEDSVVPQIDAISQSIDYKVLNLSLDHSKCPTCLREIDDECINHINDEKAKSEKSLKELSRLKQSLEEKRAIHHDKMGKRIELENELSKSKSSLHQIDNLIERNRQIRENSENDKQRRIKNLSDELAKLPEKDTLTDSLTKNESQYDECQKLMTQYLESEKAYKSYLDQLQNYIDYLKAEISKSQVELSSLKEYPQNSVIIELNDEIDAIQDANKKRLNDISTLEYNIAHYSFLKEMFSDRGLKSFVFDAITPVLNEKAEYYSNLISGGKTHISFSTQTSLKSGEVREKFSITVTTEGASKDYSGLSGGEKKRADIIILKTVREVLRTFSNLTIKFSCYDEFSTDLDSVGKEQVFNLLQKEAEELGTVFIISHDSEWKSLCNNVITVTKDEQGISQVAA